MFKFTRNCMYSMHSMYLILIFQNTDRIMMPMKCDLCDQNATEKHHVTYYPERTIPVCAFHGDDIQKKVKVLSGGEKTRLAMIKLLLEPVNLLILDEPSNHLDMKTKDIIKEALKDFDGTLILVSHDRDFLDGLATKVFEFGNKRVKEHFEDIKGFLAHKKMESLREIEK